MYKISFNDTQEETEETEENYLKRQSLSKKFE